MAERLTIEVPVAWGDMDAFGHVNNVVYLRWFESGRIAFFDHVGISHVEVSKSCAPILARTTCDFRRPLRYPDTVAVHTGLSRIGTKSFAMTYRIHSHALDDTAAEGEGIIVWYDYAADRSVAIPEALRERLRPFCA
jgi:acyl-CoA thioester hydrolase